MYLIRNYLIRQQIIIPTILFGNFCFGFWDFVWRCRWRLISDRGLKIRTKEISYKSPVSNERFQISNRWKFNFNWKSFAFLFPDFIAYCLWKFVLFFNRVLWSGGSWLRCGLWVPLWKLNNFCLSYTRKNVFTSVEGSVTQWYNIDITFLVKFLNTQNFELE